MDKHQIAEILDEIGTLLELQDENPFKVRAYHNAARAIEGLTDLEGAVQQKRLEEVPGIGAHIAEKVTILVKKGRLPYYEKLKKSTPPGLLELLKIPGLGAKKVKLLHEKLNIKTVADLLKACEQKKIEKIEGFGAKTQANILSGITKIKTFGKRMWWWKAITLAEPILEKIKKIKGVKKVEIAGSVRRKLETVGDLDFLVATANPKPVMQWFLTQAVKVLSTGPTKSSIQLKNGVQADIRVLSEKEWPYGLLYFTGSKEHNIKLRKLALHQGLSLSEYGFEGKKIKLCKSEKEIYQVLGLSNIPPELREDQGEIEVASKGKLPTLIEAKDIRGVFHCHTTESDGHNTLEEMVQGAEDLKWEYIGISDHSKSSVQANGLDAERLFAQVEKIKKLNQSKRFTPYIFAGIECDILTTGQLDFPSSVLKELDFVIVSIHRSFNLDEQKMTARLIKAIENPYTTMVGHVTGRLLLKRDPYPVNLQKVIDACIANGKIMELNAHPMRLDMDWRFWHEAKDRGLQCSINPDAHRIEDLQYYLAGVNIARKGWLTKKDIINTASLAQVRTILKRKVSGRSREQ
jgi:DNA polymerase (family 10)